MSETGAARSISLSLAPELIEKVRVGTLTAAPVSVAATAGPLDIEIERVAVDLRARLGGRSPAEIDALAPARELYRAFGIDPTKTRPSSEKLLRRVLRGGSLPRISNAVDLGNLLALQFLLPIGLYDARSIEGPVVLRSGAHGESYAGIAGQEVHLEGRPALSDDRGPFGNPTADSRRSAVGAATSALWMTVFAPASLPSRRLASHMLAAASAFERHLAGREAVRTETAVVG